MLNIGEREVWPGREKNRLSRAGISRCVTNNNTNPANDRSLLLLSSGCNAQVQKTI